MTGEEKKTVTYDFDRGVLQHPSGGVILWPIDHPDTEYVSNASFILTSEMLHMDQDTGKIETQNTIYVPNREL